MATKRLQNLFPKHLRLLADAAGISPPDNLDENLKVPVTHRLVCKNYLDLQKQREKYENKMHEEWYFQQMMNEDDERMWALAQECDEGTYFEPQEYK